MAHDTQRRAGLLAEIKAAPHVVADDASDQPTTNGGAVEQPRTARDAIALLAARCDDLRFCGNKLKGNAYESEWQRKQRPDDPNEWPTKWWNSETFCLVMSTAGLFLVDVDAAFDKDGDKLVERKPTKEEALELAEALGGTHYGYESTPGKSKWHIVFADPGNGGREWTGSTRAGFASQNGLIWQASSGAYLQFDTRGGGRYGGGAKAGEICGARIDVDKRRILKLLAALDAGVEPLHHPTVLFDAVDRRKELRSRYGRTLTGVHQQVLDETNGIAKMRKAKRAGARQRLATEAVATRAQRDGAPSIEELADQAVAEVQRAYDGAVDYHLSGVGSQFKFADVFRGRADGSWRYETDARKWWHWDGKHWTVQTQLAYRRMQSIIAELTKDDEKETAKWQQQHHVHGSLTVAGYSLHIDAQDFDANPMMAGVPGGKIVELDSGVVRKAEREDFCTKSLSVTPEEGDPEELLAFMAFAFNKYGDERKDLIRSLLWFCGDALRGTVNKADSHGFVFYHGEPGTGKSTLTNILYKVMGDYASTINASRITGRREDHLQWLLRLRGQRLAIAAELQRQPLRCEVVNALSAGDPIEANAMRQGSVDFRSSCHLVMNGNHKPSINSPGTFRRLRLVEMHTKPEEEDEDLEERIVACEGGRFLRMAIDVRRSRKRPKWPKQVQAAVKQYELENDLVGQWLAENCQESPGAHMPSKASYQNFREWCLENGYRVPSKTYLSREMKNMGHPCVDQRVGGEKTAYANAVLMDAGGADSAVLGKVSEMSDLSD